jgi:hypothetical protein
MKVPRKAIATVCASECRISSQCVPGEGGIISRTMTPRLPMPSAMRRGVMSKYQQQAAIQAISANQPAQRLARASGGSAKAAGTRARASAICSAVIGGRLR